MRSLDGSGVNREVHAPFCERPEVQFLRPTYRVHHIIDWNYDEDRSRIRTGFGPENITRLRRFAVGILKSFQKPSQTIAELMRRLCFRTRLVFDYLRMTKNSAHLPAPT